MPATSEAQRRAMFAAAEGRSTLGIPKAIGEEFVAKDAVNGIAAGIMFVAPDGDILLLRRRSGDENWAGHWDLPGGKGEPGEAPEEVAAREAGEEVGSIPSTRRKLLDSAVTPKGMAFHTFAQPAETKFAPTLSDEHSGFAWVPLDQLTTPLHPGVKQTLDRRLSLDFAGAMLPSDWEELKQNFADWTRAEPEPAMDSIAFDRETVRTIDVDGHLKVELTPISKANVCPYYGREIPDHEKLGLDGDKVYQLYRDAGELAKAAPSFAGKQLMLEHVPVSADDPHLERTVGSIGDDVTFAAPYLMAPLSIWDAEAISLIESGEQKELSSAYRYRADMTPGVSPDGERYDGVMRDILGNHVALVSRGRAGSDVLVQDALPDGLSNKGRAGPIGDSTKEIFMSKTIKLSLMGATAHGALLTYLKPKLAQDAKVDLTEALTGVTSKNFKDKRPSIVTSLKTATSGKLAKDANIDDIVDVLEAIESIAPAEDMEPNAGVPAGKKAEDEEPAPRKRINEFLKDKLSEDDMKACDALWDDDKGQEAMDEDDDEEEKKKAAKDKKGMDRKAMDAAVDQRVSKAVADARQAERNIRIAEEDVRPYIGKISVAMDSAEDVYKTALVALGVDLTDVPPAAFKAILKAQPVPGSNTVRPAIATDAASVNGFFARFPEAKTHQVKTL